MTNAQEWDKLMHFAAQLSAPLKRRFLAAVQEMQASVPLSQIITWLENGQVEQIVQAFTQEAEKTTLFRLAAQESIIAAAQKALPARLLFTFNPHNPLAADAVWANGSRLIQQVTDDVRDAVRILVVDGIQRGANPRTTARFIRDGIGLTKTQLQAVSNFRTYLQEGDPVALDRVLRDKRFDSLVRQQIEGKTKLSSAKIEEMVSAYYRRYLNYRAESIARTESINALSTGSRLAWQQLFASGKVNEGDVRRFWHVAKDERTCEWCAPVPSMNPEGVAFRQDFNTPLGPRVGPTLHPHCRCVVFTKFV